MALSVIGAGFGRTGTRSLKSALDILGLGPCHHMQCLFADGVYQLPLWQNVIAGGNADWDHLFHGYRSCVDWPGTHYWRQLSDFYVDAKVVLTVRPADLWYKSFSSTILKLIDTRHQIPNQQNQKVLDFANEMIVEQTFDPVDDRDHVIDVYNQRIADVRAYIDPNRLLIFNVTDGWGPLCEFLQLQIPTEPFPHLNKLEDFWSYFRADSERL